MQEKVCNFIFVTPQVRLRDMLYVELNTYYAGTGTYIVKPGYSLT